MQTSRRPAESKRVSCRTITRVRPAGPYADFMQVQTPPGQAGAGACGSGVRRCRGYPARIADLAQLDIARAFRREFPPALRPSRVCSRDPRVISQFADLEYKCTDFYDLARRSGSSGTIRRLASNGRSANRFCRARIARPRRSRSSWMICRCGSSPLRNTKESSPLSRLESRNLLVVVYCLATGFRRRRVSPRAPNLPECPRSQKYFPTSLLPISPFRSVFPDWSFTICRPPLACSCTNSPLFHSDPTKFPSRRNAWRAWPARALAANN